MITFVALLLKKYGVHIVPHSYISSIWFSYNKLFATHLLFKKMFTRKTFSKKHLFRLFLSKFIFPQWTVIKRIFLKFYCKQIKMSQYFMIFYFRSKMIRNYRTCLKILFCEMINVSERGKWDLPKFSLYTKKFLIKNHRMCTMVYTLLKFVCRKSSSHTSNAFYSKGKMYRNCTFVLNQ